ncbi:MAG: penicillin-binding protein 1C [Bacteroidetes bacterium]|nr:penicillin-binding protein 1C [Bacteroidota bacterium]MBS1757161.1 penicillin-binding protein 1C [Bacteroidota bacterium]
MQSLHTFSKIKILSAVGLLIWFWLCLPHQLFNEPTSYVIEDADGNLLSATIAADGQWRFPYNKSVPQKFIDCITSFEDHRFFYHPGIDLISLWRATIKNIKTGKIVQGGSTLTMQVIRLSQKNDARNFINKIKESILAVRLEMSYSKHEILALYASNAPFGSNVVGLDAAAWRYFGRSANKLSWAEMATLAVLPNAPSLVHPGRNRDLLLQKRNMLLDKLFANNKISKSECDLAKLEPLPGAPLALPQFAPHLLQRFKKENISGSTKIETTINSALQKNISRIIQQHHNILKGNGINNACALVLDVETGNTLAYVGNINEQGVKEMESDVDVIAAPRSPGSALKPVLYAAMLSDGLILPNALVPDIPTQIGSYVPKNFDLGYDGAVPASRALARSLNIPAVKLLQQYKYQRFYETLQQCGITTLNRTADTYGLSLILGGCEVNMWDMAGMYSSMARMLNHQAINKGKTNPADFHAPNYIKNGPIRQLNKTPVPFDATSIWFIFQAMEEVMRPGEEGLWQEFSSSQKIAWKTGTSFGFRDGWAIGITPKNVVAVWVGNADGEGRPGLVGVQTAAPIMFDIFRLLPSVSWFARPAYNFTFVPVCRQSGYRANIDCPDVDTLFMPQNAIKSPLCPYHKIIHLDPSGTYQVTAQCESPTAMLHKSWFILPPAMEYYYKQKNADYKVLPAFKPGCDYTQAAKEMEIIYPQQDAKIYVPLEISGEKGKTIFTATHRKQGMKIFWSLDDTFVGTTQNFHQLALDPSPGKHIITLTDENGVSISRSFEILEKEK